MINIKNLIVSIGKDWPLLTKEEKAAMRKVMMEGLLLSSYRFLKYKTEDSLTKSQDKFKIKNRISFMKIWI